MGAIQVRLLQQQRQAHQQPPVLHLELSDAQRGVHTLRNAALCCALPGLWHLCCGRQRRCLRRNVTGHRCRRHCASCDSESDEGEGEGEAEMAETSKLSGRCCGDTLRASANWLLSSRICASYFLRRLAGSDFSWHTGTVRTHLARDANRSVLWLSSECSEAGVTLQMIIDQALPPKLFCRTRVILEER
eukprot:scaffold68267_cov75-Phaeocystis_antarctica.AAC.2